MKQVVVVVAPHPDDETIGCGGTLLRHIEDGDECHWLICTEMRLSDDYDTEAINARRREISAVAVEYKFTAVHQLGFAAAQLDCIPLQDIIEAVRKCFDRIVPTIVYLPFVGDAHTDHKRIFEAGIACCKPFRRASVQQVLCYETVSETDIAVNPSITPFFPNVFVDITKSLDKKIGIMSLYASEFGKFPFPRSEQSLRSLAHVRGATAGMEAAESFMLLRQTR